MLQIFSGGNRRGVVSRREMLQVGTLALGGVSLHQWLAARESLGASQGAAKDLSVVMLFLTGGPSQIETFDPKMTAPSETRSVTGEVQTTIPGVAFGGTFPKLAALASQMAVVRSFTHTVSDHTKAVEQVTRGGNPINQAAMGAIATNLRGTSHPRTGMPTHVYVAAKEVDRQFDKERLRLLDAAGGGQLGGAYAPFEAGGASTALDNMRIGIQHSRLNDRVALRKKLDRLQRRLDDDGRLASLNRFEQQALELVLGRSSTAFDVSKEDPALVARYDTSRFITGIHANRASTLGHQLLLARRLCEAGCGFVTVHNPGWDMHGGPTQFDIPNGMETLGRPVDHAVSVFLDDIRQRGLDKKILFILTGEFGRTVRVKDNAGRDHWPHLSTLALAGGGLNMGQVVGTSNSRAAEPRSDPVTLSMLFATVMHALFDVPALRNDARLPREIVTLLERGEPIRQLF